MVSASDQKSDRASRYAANTPATSFAIGYHILSFIPITVIGLWYFVRLDLHLKEIDKAREGPA